MGLVQDELNAEIREKKKERNQNSKAFSENRRLSQTVREMIRAKKFEDARRACEEQVSRKEEIIRYQAIPAWSAGAQESLGS